MKYLKEHLVHQYSWPHHTASIYTGMPSRRLFDPYNGVQVLFIINCFYDLIGLTSIQAGRKLEKLIYTQLPAEIKSELAVFNWLKGIYLYHAD